MTHWRENIENFWYNQEWKDFRDRMLRNEESFDPQFSLPLPQPDLASDGITISRPLLNCTRAEHAYARGGSPLEDAVRKLAVQMEAGYAPAASEHLDATVFPSGMAAISTLIHFLSYFIPPSANRKELHFVIGDQLYPETQSLFHDYVPQLGFGKSIPVDMGKPNMVAEILAYNQRNIVALYYEPLSNPQLKYTNTRALRQIADWHDLPMIVDSTLLPPYLQQQFRLGADIVIQSASKYLSGQADILAGICTASASCMRSLRKFQRIHGNVADQQVLQKLYRRIPLQGERMEAYLKNAAPLVEYLCSSPAVEKVLYPDLEKETRYGSAGAVISFLLAGHSEQEKQEKEKNVVQAVCEYQNVPISCEVGFGQEKYLLLGQSHFGTGTPPGLIRLAVGRSDPEPVIAFLEKIMKVEKVMKR